MHLITDHQPNYLLKSSLGSLLAWSIRVCVNTGVAVLANSPYDQIL